MPYNEPNAGSDGSFLIARSSNRSLGATALGPDSPVESRVSRRDSEDVRRKQLIDTTILVMAQVGFSATTLGLIAKQAGVSTGLVAHYFGDKDGLLEATLRSLASRLSRAAASRMRAAATPRARLQAVIDANLAPEEMDQQTGAVWLAFWGQAIHSERLLRMQRIYQLRVLSNLRHALRSRAPASEAERLADHHRRHHRRALAADDAGGLMEPVGRRCRCDGSPPVSSIRSWPPAWKDIRCP